MNKQLLQSFIVKYDGNQRTLAAAMGIALQTLNAKINENRSEFTVPEMEFIRSRYNFSEEDYKAVFFANCVSK